MAEPSYKTTYRRADGELICGEYGWVADLEYFENDDEPTELIEETWLQLSSRKFWYPEPPKDEEEEGDDG